MAAHAKQKKPSLADLPLILKQGRAFAKKRGITPKAVLAAIMKVRAKKSAKK